MNWPKLKSRELRFVLFTVGVVFVVLNYMLVLPWWHATRQRSEKLRGGGREIERRVQILKSVESMRKEKAALTRGGEISSPHVENQEAWMKHFETLKDQSGVQLTYRKPKTENGKLRVEYTLNGSLESIVKLMYALSTDASHPHIDYCQLSPLKDGADQLKGQLTIFVSMKKS